MRGIAGALSVENYELVIYTVDSADRLQGYLASLPLTGNLDGLISLSLPVGDTEARRLVEHALPTVLIEYPHSSLNSVEIDDVQGGIMAAQYLLHKGHRRIAFLGDTELPEYSIHPVSLRLAGFRQALQSAKVPLPEEFVGPAHGHFCRDRFPGFGGDQGRPPDGGKYPQGIGGDRLR